MQLEAKNSPADPHQLIVAAWCMVLRSNLQLKSRLSGKVFPDQLVIASLSQKVKVKQTCAVYFQDCVRVGVRECKRM